MTSEAKGPLMVMGTSGSTDYLREGTVEKRYWLVGPPLSDPDTGACDGVHDEGAPPQHLCTRCFPDRSGDPRDLSAHADDEYGDNCRDEQEEIE